MRTIKRAWDTSQQAVFKFSAKAKFMKTRMVISPYTACERKLALDVFHKNEYNYFYQSWCSRSLRFSFLEG
jgi:hypothetical protein